MWSPGLRSKGTPNTRSFGARWGITFVGAASVLEPLAATWAHVLEGRFDVSLPLPRLLCHS